MGMENEMGIGIGMGMGMGIVSLGGSMKEREWDREGERGWGICVIAGEMRARARSDYLSRCDFFQLFFCFVIFIDSLILIYLISLCLRRFAS